MKKILIANRGEIAVRVIRTANKLGIATVAVYHQADSAAVHVKLADEAYLLDGVSLSETYLNIEKVVAIAKSCGADGIHPGYGFLSENAQFAAAIAEAGIAFIGPSADAIELMGSKARAKQIMEKANVPLIPGFHRSNTDDQTLREAADRIGFPLLIKAAAGGGGKGMRVVEDRPEFDNALNAAKREARAAFGDDTMILEKLLVDARHIEVQIFCDSQGNGVYLYERDCSMQRRHQKVIEEAPAKIVTPSLRQAMGEAAVRAAKAIDYRGAGTVEFLLDSDGAFYFMEMNTRLQVEHPVTEAVTQQDLVEWQIVVARNESLPLTQEQIPLVGHAIEVRLYAEDTSNHFLPSSGRIDYLSWPDHVRIDSGFQTGDRVTTLFDPMLAKIIVHADDRDTAIAEMSTALANTHIFGLKTNTDLLRRLCTDSDFVNGNITTAWLDQHIDEVNATSNDYRQQVANAWLAHQQSKKALSAWESTDDFRLFGATKRRYYIDVDGEQMLCQPSEADQSNWQFVTITGATLAYTQGIEATVTAHLPLRKNTSTDQHRDVTAVMSSVLVKISVSEGDTVKQGQQVAILEAMKMEHPLYAPADGIVRLAAVSEGQQLSDGELIFRCEEAQ